VDLGEIKVFLVLADELHFGRTAERLYLSQSRVSQTIKAMEERLGGKLFHRTSRQVRLTLLGEQFRDRMRPAYDEIKAAIDEVKSSAGGAAGNLRLGLWSLPSGGPWLSMIISTFHHRYPHCRVSVTDSAPLRQLDELRSGNIDMLALWMPVHENGLTIGPTLARESRVVEIASNHPLARRTDVTLEDLGDYEVPSFFGVPADSLTSLVPTSTPNGRPIRRHPQQVSSRTEMLHLVISGEVVHPCVESVPRYYRHPGVTYRTLCGLPPVESALVWSSASENTNIRTFAATAADVLTAHCAAP
jgi:DNA-binding transcriptional LysR family regulator